jgi:hypothetical protein
MTSGYKKISTIGDIRIQLTSAIKGWHQLTSDLLWPENDDSLTAMETHISTLRTVNARLAVAETRLPPSAQKTLATHFDEESVQDPDRFESFAAAVEMAVAA